LVKVKKPTHFLPNHQKTLSLFSLPIKPIKNSKSEELIGSSSRTSTSSFKTSTVTNFYGHHQPPQQSSKPLQLYIKKFQKTHSDSSTFSNTFTNLEKSKNHQETNSNPALIIINSDEFGFPSQVRNNHCHDRTSKKGSKKSVPVGNLTPGTYEAQREGFL
jgi:hypothetical protein